MGKVKYVAADDCNGTAGLLCSGLSSLSTVWGNSLHVDILPKYPYQQAWFPVVKEALLFHGKDALHQQIKQSL